MQNTCGPQSYIAIETSGAFCFRASVILLVSLTCRGDCLAFANEKTSKQDHTNYVVYRSWWMTTYGLPYVCNGCI